MTKTIDKRELQKTTKEKKTKAERSKGNQSSGERVRAKWFCCAFKLDFLQLICKASLIFKSNLELALSIIVKQRGLYQPKHVAVEWRRLNIWDLLSFLICSSVLVLKWRQVPPVQLALQLAQVTICTRKDFKPLKIGSLYEKEFLILYELKTSLMLQFCLQNSLQSFESLFWYGLKFCRYMVI